jgi:hypothetical protein
MDLKFIYYLLLIILRAGLVESINEFESVERHETSTTLEEKPMPTESFPNDHYSKIPPDKCSESGVIRNCTLKKPYCFVDGDNISCGPTRKIGWRISPLDGLILNNGQIPNPNCELFKPPENFEIKEIIMNLLNYSEFGSGYYGRESSWFNTFEYLGNCPLKSQYCDKDSLTCQNLLGAGKNCTSSNQCLSHYCEKYDENASDYTTERRCVEDDDMEDSLGKKDDNNKVSGGRNDSLLIIIILLSVGFAILILVIVLFLIKAQRKKRLLSNSKKLFPSDNYLPNNTTINDDQSGFVAKHLSSFSSLRSSLLSRISTISRSYSKNGKRVSNDQYSVLLPPPPTLNRESFLYNNNYYNNNYYYLDNVNDNDSFDIYPSNHIQQHETFI